MEPRRSAGVLWNVSYRSSSSRGAHAKTGFSHISRAGLITLSLFFLMQALIKRATKIKRRPGRVKVLDFGASETRRCESN